MLSSPVGLGHLSAISLTMSQAREGAYQGNGAGRLSVLAESLIDVRHGSCVDGSVLARCILAANWSSAVMCPACCRGLCSAGPNAIRLGRVPIISAG